MPVAIRATGSGFARRPVIARGGLAGAIVTLLCVPAIADGAERLARISLSATTLASHDYVFLALTVGVILFATLCAVALVRSRARIASLTTAFSNELTALRGAVDRANALINSESQLLVIWPADADEPEIIGDPVRSSCRPTAARHACV